MINSDSNNIILAIESSCDDTSVAVIKNGILLSNVTANQSVHIEFGGVVPELASRAHQQNIIPVVQKAIKEANIDKNEISAVGFTRGPGLLGSLLVGTSFAKGFALANNIPLIEVNHMRAHILAHFVKRKGEENKAVPQFPFICLTVSGGHTQIVLVKDYFDMRVIGQTIDDAAGEAFDKSAKILGLPYPGGPLIDKHAKKGNPIAFKFPHPKVGNYDYSFSGLKTAILYFLRKENQKDENFIVDNINDLCASIQRTIIDILMKKLILAVKEFDVKDVCLAGGVSANSELRDRLKTECELYNWNGFIPDFEYCTDNAGMIAITAYHKFLNKDFTSQNVTPNPRMKLGI